MAKSSAAPATPQVLNKDVLRENRKELAEAICDADYDSQDSQEFAERAGELIAAHEKAYAVAAHQALYEALSAALEDFEWLHDCNNGFTDEGWVRRIERTRAALALADAAKEQV